MEKYKTVVLKSAIRITQVFFGKNIFFNLVPTIKLRIRSLEAWVFWLLVAFGNNGIESAEKYSERYTCKFAKHGEKNIEGLNATLRSVDFTY